MQLNHSTIKIISKSFWIGSKISLSSDGWKWSEIKEIGGSQGSIIKIINLL